MTKNPTETDDPTQETAEGHRILRPSTMDVLADLEKVAQEPRDTGERLKRSVRKIATGSFCSL